jgi:hypothetical protein
MRHRRSHRRGISLMLVTAFVGVASVLGLALLSSAALQSAATRNQDLVIQADGLAESGINLATYWVQNLADSNKCPSNVANLAIGGKYNQTGVTFKNVPGKVKVTVERLTYNRFQVTAVGKSDDSGGQGVNRSLTAQVDANYYGYAISATNLGSGNLVIPATTVITGDIFSTVPVTLATGATVNGEIFDAPASGGGGGGGGGLLGGLLGGVVNLLTGTLNAVIATLVPTPATANHYLTYSYNNKTYAAREITATSLKNTTLTPDANNPLGIFYHKGTLTLEGGAKVNGTLVIKDVAGGLLGLGADPGVLRVKNQANAIAQSAPNYPALLADSDVSFESQNATLDVAGLAYTGGRVTHNGNVTGSVLNIVGGLLFGGPTASLDSNVTTRLTYNRVRNSVPSLVTTATPAPTSVTVVYWKNQ